VSFSFFDFVFPTFPFFDRVAKLNFSQAMGKRDKSQTGANTEPMPFIRKFGNEGSSPVDLMSIKVEQPVRMEPQVYGMPPMLPVKEEREFLRSNSI
jgi:hypothetical protein